MSKCTKLLSDKALTFIKPGTTNMAFESDNEVIRIPYNLIRYGTRVARAEIRMLREFHRIINKANVGEFRPLTFMRLQKFEDLPTSYIPIIEKERKILGIAPFDAAHEIMVTERVQGMSLLQIIESTTISTQDKKRLVERYNSAIFKLYKYIQSNFTHSPNYSLSIVNTKGLTHELSYPSAYLHWKANLNGEPLEFYFDINDNILVDNNGMFVLIDPN